MIAPPFLKEGDKVAVIGTAKVFPAEKIKSGIKYLTDHGLTVVEGANLYKQDNHFSGTDKERASDLQGAVDNPEIKAVFCARGGYGTSRIIDMISFDALKDRPKWFIGFSDVTILHTHLQKLGIESLHGTMPIQFSSPEYKYSTDLVINFLFGRSLEYKSLPGSRHNASGEAEGIITGGNLSLLINSIGTPSEVNTDGTILFLEETGEYLYHIDRMLVQLKRAGKFKNLRGVIVGAFSGTRDNKDLPFGHTIQELILEKTAGYDYPVCFDFPAGHIPPNLPLIFGREARLRVDMESSSLYFSR